MSEYADREHARGSATTSSRAEPQPTAADRAGDAVVRCVREVEGVEHAITSVRDASEPRAWHEARATAVREVANAERSIARAHAHQREASPELQQKLGLAAAALASAKGRLAELTTPPRGWRPVPGEDQLIAILAKPITGGNLQAWDAKELELKAVLGTLGAADARALAARIGKPHDDDVLVSALGRMVPQRRARIVDFINGARRREAVAAARAAAQPAEPAHEPHLKKTPFGEYVRVHSVDIEVALARHLDSVPWPDPSAEVPFVAGGERVFVELLKRFLAPHLRSAEELPSLLDPSDILAVFHQVAPNLKEAGWNPTFALAMAQAVEASAKASLRRLGPRYHDALVRRGHRPDADDLLTSHPFDPLVVGAMVSPGVLVEQTSGSASPATAPVARVDARWLGRTHPELWNFVQVAQADARVEDVAATLWGDDRKSMMAVAIHKYGDVFRIAPAQARQLITERYRGELVGDSNLESSAQILALAHSDLREGDAATRELTPSFVSAPSAEALAQIELHIGEKLDQIRAAVTPVGLSGELHGTYTERLARLGRMPSADAATRARWLPVLQFQHTQLLAIVPQVSALVAMVAAKTGDERAQLVETLELYVRAAAVSHLRDESNAIMQTIAQRQHRGARQATDASQRELASSTRAAVATPEGSMAGTTHAEEQIAAEREAVLGGRAPDQHHAITLAGEVALQGRMRWARHSLAQLHVAATEVFGDPEHFHKLFPSIKTYPEVIADVQAHLADVQHIWDAATKANTPLGPADPKGSADQLAWQGRTAGLAAARVRFERIAGDQTLTEFCETARAKIRHQQVVNAVVKLGKDLLLTLAAGMGAAALGRMAAGALVGEAAGWAERGAAMIIDVSVNASVNSAVQVAMSDGKAEFGWAMLENTLMELFTRGLNKPLHAIENAARTEGRVLAQLPHLEASQRAAFLAVDYSGAHLLVDYVGGMATQWAGQRLVQFARGSSEAISDPFALSVLQQGAAIGLGKFFHGRVHAWQQHRTALERTQLAELPEMKALFAERDAFHQLAAATEANLSPEPALFDQLSATEVRLTERESAIIAAHPELLGRGHAREGSPAHTPWGDVWPGEVPPHAPDAQRKVFEQAAQVYAGLKGDGFQGASVGRIRWTEYLGAHGIAVEGRVHFGGSHPVHEHRDVERTPAPSDVALPRDAALGERSANTDHVTAAQCLAAVDELIAHGVALKGAHRRGNLVTVPTADGRAWSIEIASTRATHADDMAALAHGAHGETVWVSDTLTNEQVSRALGAILGEAMAFHGRTAGDGARFGELDAMLAHREQVAATPRPEPPSHHDGDEGIKAHALAESRVESVERIDAELDLLLSRMGLTEPGPRRDEQLANMRPALAERIRARLAQREVIQFKPAGAMADAAVPQPGNAPKTSLPASPVMPDTPAHVRAYNAGDLRVVLELRVELETLREIDARTAQRDKPGTNGGADIAKGETQRRVHHLARARALMAELQLGGDKGYVQARLRELEAVFPGVERDLVPAMEARVERRESAAAEHHAAEAFRAERDKRQQAVRDEVLAQKFFTTQRLVVGDGFSGLADIASLGVAKSGTWLPPSELLVIGRPDLIALLAARDPSFRWGQRAAAYDRATDAHPAFSDTRGQGNGELHKAVEDPGEFLHVGGVRDAMDRARERLGVASVAGKAWGLELATDGNANPAWDVDPKQFPARVRVTIGSETRLVYTSHADLATGPGKPRMPNETILSARDRKEMLGAENGKGVLFSGEKLLEGKGRDLAGKHVLVMNFGPTGAWAVTVAAQSGAARVDFTGGVGGEGNTAMSKQVIADWKKRQHASGEAPPKATKGDVPSNDSAYYDMTQLDRLQDVASIGDNVHLTTDRIVHIEKVGDGAVVTYAHGPGENAEVYQVTYDVIVTNMGYTTNINAPDVPGEPTLREIIGKRKMVPQKGTRAPVLQDETGVLRIMGFAAGDRTNVTNDRQVGSDLGARDELAERGKKIAGRMSADSPDERVVEGVGMSSRRSNRNGAANE